MNTQQTLDYLADNAILTLITYGYMGIMGRCFSVSIILATNMKSSEPQAAYSFIEAVQVAYHEAVRMGWVKEYETNDT